MSRVVGRKRATASLFRRVVGFVQVIAIPVLSVTIAYLVYEVTSLDSRMSKAVGLSTLAREIAEGDPVAGYASLQAAHEANLDARDLSFLTSIYWYSAGFEEFLPGSRNDGAPIFIATEDHDLSGPEHYLFSKKIRAKLKYAVADSEKIGSVFYVRRFPFEHVTGMSTGHNSLHDPYLRFASIRKGDRIFTDIESAVRDAFGWVPNRRPTILRRFKLSEEKDRRLGADIAAYRFLYSPPSPVCGPPDKGVVCPRSAYWYDAKQIYCLRMEFSDGRVVPEYELAQTYPDGLFDIEYRVRKRIGEFNVTLNPRYGEMPMGNFGRDFPLASLCVLTPLNERARVGEN